MITGAHGHLQAQMSHQHVAGPFGGNRMSNGGGSGLVECDKRECSGGSHHLIYWTKRNNGSCHIPDFNSDSIVGSSPYPALKFSAGSDIDLGSPLGFNSNLKHMERRNEREAFLKGRNLANADIMEEKTNWRPLILLDTDGQIPVEHGKNSKEKDIQAIRQKETLQPLYFHNAMIPDTPAEPDLETHPYQEHIIIILDDVTGNQDNISDFRNMPWPETKGNAPPSTPTNINMALIYIYRLTDLIDISKPKTSATEAQCYRKNLSVTRTLRNPLSYFNIRPIGRIQIGPADIRLGVFISTYYASPELVVRCAAPAPLRPAAFPAHT
ncbi:hypothetical protein EVAR_30654_1 [Eumeta japonica]|uniref:Uncharacterized protein n=1 Tax=Eumeta variegata TaxID=151549 RepID=A0A4C1VQ25_EUMVA|nr:hypothetical protein EVAR_30654_1 [Eumeta japonica]